MVGVKNYLAVFVLFVYFWVTWLAIPMLLHWKWFWYLVCMVLGWKGPTVGIQRCSGVGGGGGGMVGGESVRICVSSMFCFG